MKGVRRDVRRDGWPTAWLRSALAQTTLLLLALLTAHPAWAQPLPPTQTPAVPDALQPWVPWVLHGHEAERCTRLSGRTAPLCAWPATLSLDLDDKGGRFTLDVVSERDMYVALPGSATRFPQNVTLGDSPAIVLEGPQAFVPAGKHRLSGRFDWQSLPESLQTPAQVGLLNLQVRGQRVAEPRRDENGNLWLQSDGTGSEDEKRLEIHVHRHIQDGVPLHITTRIELSVGGRAREVVLDKTQLPGTRTIDVQGDLPVRLEPDGQLRVQVVAGEHRITLTSVAPHMPEALQMPTPTGLWAEQEVWVWSAAPAFRQVELSGGTRVEPGRTDLASDWHGMPTFIMQAGESLALETRRRGDAAPAPNRLDIHRELWLDQDGSHFTVRDHLNGTMHDGFRLDLMTGKLGRVSLDGQDHLITTYEGLSGVEIRNSQLQMQAEWRLAREGSGRLPAVAWAADADSLATTLHLPPGWSLFHVGGVDDASGTTLSHWDLWSFFFVLLVTLGAAKLRGIAVGALGLLTLVLCYHEPLAPELLWLWLLSAMALTRMPLHPTGGKLARAMLWAAVATIALWSVPFVVHQVRSALYPQLETHRMAPALLGTASAPEMPQAENVADLGYADSDSLAGARSPADFPEEAEAAPMKMRDALVSSSPRGKARYALTEVDPNALTQTGPGVPSWQHHSYSLQWSGPVSSAQQLTLWLIPPALYRSLAIARVLLLGLFFAALLRKQGGPAGGSQGRSGWSKAWGRPRKSKAADPAQTPVESAAGAKSGGADAMKAVAIRAALVLLCLLATQNARAELGDPEALASELGVSNPSSAPSADLLDELRKRLLAEPECSGPCVSAADMTLTLSGDRLTIRTRVHAGAATTYRAPGPLSAWSPDTLQVDNSEFNAAARLEDGFLHVRLLPGAHEVVLSGPTPNADALTLQLGTQPHRIQVQAREWEVDGLRNDGSANGTIALRRRVARAEQSDAEVALPPWLLIRRRFDFGLQFRVETELERQGNISQALVVRYPLLKGEEITQAHVEAESGSAVVRFEAGQARESFNSTLQLQSELTLQTPLDSEAGRYPFSEQWELSCSPLYRCSADGLVPHGRVDEAQAVETYMPLPGERLTLRLQRLQGAEGTSTTIDNAQLEWRPGDRITTATLALNVRSSGGTTVRVSLPSAARLGSVQVDQEPRSAQLQEGQLELSMDPGLRRVEIPFQLNEGFGFRFKAPVVKVEGELVNTTISISVPDNRWLLWVAGPEWGPAVLFWGYLLTGLLFALGLSLVPASPLRMHQWALLSLGLAPLSPAAAFVVVLWFFAIWARSHWVPPGHVRFNLVQLAIVGLSFITAGTLIEAVRQGLLFHPDMQVAGNGSYDRQLLWYVDRAKGQLPAPAFFSLPLWVYKGLMLLWALWLASSILTWLRWGYQGFSNGGRFKPLRGPKPAAEGLLQTPIKVEPGELQPVEPEPYGGAPSASEAAGAVTAVKQPSKDRAGRPVAPQAMPYDLDEEPTVIRPSPLAEPTEPQPPKPPLSPPRKAPPGVFRPRDERDDDDSDA